MGYPKAEWLRAVRDALGEPPRSFAFWDRITYLRVPMPGWARGDPIKLYFNGRRRLLQDGFVTWGHFVQANYLLFKPGPFSAPAEMVFGLDPARDPDPGVLESTAGRLFELKGATSTDPEAAAIGRHLPAERTRAFGMPIPRAFRAPQPLALSTVFVCRAHLPQPRFLHHRLLPLLVSPTDPRIIMPVPARYWPDPLLTWWSEG